MTMTMTLHHYWRSSCSWRIRWALNLKGLPYATKAVNLVAGEQRSDAYLQLNPMGFVPTLVVTTAGDAGASNKSVMSESGAILEWLEERYPAPALMPSTPDERYHVRRLAHTILSGTQPIQNLAVQKYVSKDPQTRQEFAKHFISAGLSTYETLLQTSAPGTYSCGGQITHADLCLVPQVYNAKRFGVDMGMFPMIAAIYDRCLATSSCADAAPEKFKP